MRLVVTVGLLVMASLPAQSDEDPRLERTRSELLAQFELPPGAVAVRAATPKQLANVTAALRRLRPVERSLRVLSADRKALADLSVTAAHQQWDIRTEPEATDNEGRVRLRLPPGPWAVDVSGRVGDTTLAFGRFTVEDESEAARTLVLGTPRHVRVVLPTGRTPRDAFVAVATPDLTHQYVAEVDATKLAVSTPPEQDVVVQAWRAPSRSPGYLVRSLVPASAESLKLELNRKAMLQVDGRDRRTLTVRIGTLDALAAPLEIQTRARRDLYVAGLEEVAVGYEVASPALNYHVHAGPMKVNQRRVITGKPDFRVSASYMRNGMSRYRQQRNSLSFRVFLRDPHGLIVRGHARSAPFTVDWKARAGKRVLAKGSMTGSWRSRIPALTVEEREALELDLEMRGQGVRVRETLRPLESTDVAQGRAVICHALPELGANARLWLGWADQLVAAFKESTHFRPSELKVYCWVHAMPGLSGWGGVTNRRSFAMFADGRLFGFVRPRAQNDLTVSHELAHAFDIGNHGSLFQALQSRAVRRMKSLREDAHRVPAGNVYRQILEDLPEDGDILGGASDGKLPAIGAAAAVDAQVHEDEFLLWYLRSVRGPDASVAWRRDWHYFRWWLTLRGYTDDEIRGACISHFAGENLAWLIRLRGGQACFERVASAMAEIEKPSGEMPVRVARRAVLQRWARAPLPAKAELPSAVQLLRGELGSRSARADTLLRWAQAALFAQRTEDARTLLQAALTDAWPLDRAEFMRVLSEAATVWSGRPSK